MIAMEGRGVSWGVLHSRVVQTNDMAMPPIIGTGTMLDLLKARSNKKITVGDAALAMGVERGIARDMLRSLAHDPESGVVVFTTCFRLKHNKSTRCPRPKRAGVKNDSRAVRYYMYSPKRKMLDKLSGKRVKGRKIKPQSEAVRAAAADERAAALTAIVRRYVRDNPGCKATSVYLGLQAELGHVDNRRVYACLHALVDAGDIVCVPGLINAHLHYTKDAVPSEIPLPISLRALAALTSTSRFTVAKLRGEGQSDSQIVAAYPLPAPVLRP